MKEMESNFTPPFSGQDSTANSQSSRSKTDPAWEHVSKEIYANGRKALTCLHCKKVAKGRGIHRMKKTSCWSERGYWTLQIRSS